MRYLGNKTRLLGHINQLIEDKNISGGVFADLFTGTGSVADHFKDRFEIITNDLLRYASLFSEAKVSFSEVPKFPRFKKHFKVTPFEYWNTYDYSNETAGFITLNFSPRGDRKFFQEKNAIKIDTIRRQLDEFREANLLSEKEWAYLLASLLESVMGVSNTSGTYEAFFKDWEARSNKDLLLEPLSIENLPLFSKRNVTYNNDSNELVRHIEGDVAYIDTPYTVTQYASAYHVLETIALNDSPEIAGKTGRRVERKMSDYNKRNAAKVAFEDLLRQLKFTHVIISYSNQSLIPLDEFVELIQKFAIDGDVEVRAIDFREYKNLNASQKGDGKKLQEVLIYFKKDFEIVKSPLNYAGSKDLIMDKITAALPAHISNFVDMTGGAFNVGGNVAGTGRTFYNEKNPVVFEMVQRLLLDEPESLIVQMQAIVEDYGLTKADKDAYLRLRNHYNSVDIDQRDPIELFVLTLYSFQHMIRFNKNGGFNVPVGNSGLTDDVIDRLINYRTKIPLGGMTLGSFTDVDMNQFDEDTLFYFDPPYIITSAAYNDGKRLEAEWTERDEYELLNYLERLDNAGRKFLLSNTVIHKGQRNEILLDWVERNGYDMQEVGRGGRRYPRLEVLIKNY
ncbi:modification methylase [Leuconostoc falkenbergense]|uniref:DNA adenine methylase n=1 Tax=Leuconostoc falkenbergense TaxID=2766470 RepID=UPI0021AAB44C|nr:DNA adenine methylase [Leuconostoc falkenbergense]MCT4420116.1 modification methylase [Leuconostoc falkenbergense]